MGMCKFGGYPTWEVFEISCSIFKQFIMRYAYDTDHTQICSPDIKLIRIHTHDADITLSVWMVNQCGIRMTEERMAEDSLVKFLLSTAVH